MRRQGRNTDYFEAMQTDEFDFLRAETMMIIPKLKEAGVYLDHCEIVTDGVHAWRRERDDVQALRPVLDAYMTQCSLTEAPSARRTQPW